jgi:hypothetical protein
MDPYNFNLKPFLKVKLEGGLSNRDYERWIKGALGEQCLSLNRLRVEGLWEGSFTGDPERYVKDLEWASVYIGAPLLGNMKGHSFHWPLR